MTEQINSIQKMIDLPVDLPRAWRAISTAEDIQNWFSDHAKFESKVGAEIEFEWDDYGKKYGRVEIIEAPYRFGFRWLAGEPGGKDVPLTENNSTLVIMELDEIPGGIRLTVTESGFSKLPAEMQKSELVKNTGGWDYEFNDLKNYIEREGS